VKCPKYPYIFLSFLFLFSLYFPFLFLSFFISLSSPILFFSPPLSPYPIGLPLSLSDPFGSLSPSSRPAPPPPLLPPAAGPSPPLAAGVAAVAVMAVLVVAWWPWWRRPSPVPPRPPPSPLPHSLVPRHPLPRASSAPRQVAAFCPAPAASRPKLPRRTPALLRTAAQWQNVCNFGERIRTHASFCVCGDG